MEISILMKILREKNNLSQVQLSEISGVSRGNIGDIERGANKNPSCENLKKIINSFEKINEDEKEQLFLCITPDYIRSKFKNLKKENIGLKEQLKKRE